MIVAAKSSQNWTWITRVSMLPMNVKSDASSAGSSVG